VKLSNENAVVCSFLLDGCLNYICYTQSHLLVICDKEQHFSFKDSTEIVLLRTDSQEKVKGIFEIKFSGDIDDEFVSSFL